MGYKRRIILLNKSFQLRFSFYVCSWLIALTLAYPLIITNLFDYFIRYLALDPMGPALPHLEQKREEILWLLLLMQGLLLLLTFTISIYMSHKIAGPLYRLRKAFREAANGNLEQSLVFRKRDYFQELASDYSAMMASIQSKFGKGIRGIELAIPRIEKALDNASPDMKLELEAALLALRQTLKN